MNITEIRSKINGIIAAKDALDASFQKHMEASAYREYKERYDIREAIAFNLAYVITADADIARQELSNFDAICKLLGHGIKTAEYLAMLKVKAGSQFRSLKEKYSHDFSGDDVKTNMWAMMMSVSVPVGESDAFMDNIVHPYVDVLIEFIKEDGNVEEAEMEYMNRILASITNVLNLLKEAFGNNGAASSDELPLKVVKTGGTMGPKDSDGDFNILLGVDIENPNRTKLAANVSIEITLTDANGRVVEVINDSLYCIDAGATFHYGVEKKWIHGDVKSISATAYAREYVDVGDKTFMDGAVFSNFSLAHGHNDCDLTGQLKSCYNKGIEKCYVYYQFIENGRIVGGNFAIVDYLPAGATRSIKDTSFVDVKASKLEYSIDFDLGSML